MLSIGSATSNRRHARYLSDHPPFLESPGDEIGKTNSGPVFSTQCIPRCTYTRITHLPVIAFPCHNVNTRRPGRGLTYGLLNIRCIVKDYHLCRFEVNVGEVSTANKKRGDRGNAFKVVNHRGQLGHLQSELVDKLF